MSEDFSFAFLPADPTQQRREAALWYQGRHPGLRRFWTYYYGIGGEADELDLDAYLHELVHLPHHKPDWWHSLSTKLTPTTRSQEMNNSQHDATPTGNPERTLATPDSTPVTGTYEQAPQDAQGLAWTEEDFGQTLQDMVLDSPDVEEFLAEFTAVAVTKFTNASGTVSCGVTVIRRKRGTSVACNDDRGRLLDEVQNGFGDGPCLTALRHGTSVHVPDTATEDRWRDYMHVAATQGVGSILAVALDLAGEAEAVMNLYATHTHGFTDIDVDIAETMAAYAARSLRLALRIAHLRNARDDLNAAMQSRTGIDTAIGIIMAQNKCTRDAAFAILSRASSHRNIKIRDLAASIIASVSGEQNVQAYFDE